MKNEQNCEKRFRSASRQKSMIGKVAMYCATVFWRQAIYTPISSSPTISSATPTGGYTHVPSHWSLGPMPVIRRTTRWWNPSRDFSNQGSETTSRTQTGVPLTPLTHRSPLSLSYPLTNFPRSSPSVPIFSTTSGGSFPPPSNRCRRTATFVPGTGTKRPPSAVSHILGRPSPPVPLSPKQQTYVSSSTSHSGTLLKLGAPNWWPPVGKTCHTGVTGGWVGSPPPWLLCCPEGAGRKSAPGGLSVRKLYLRIPPQSTSMDRTCKT